MVLSGYGGINLWVHPESIRFKDKRRATGGNEVSKQIDIRRERVKEIERLSRDGDCQVGDKTAKGGGFTVAGYGLEVVQIMS